jgi:hypothetical protein
MTCSSLQPGLGVSGVDQGDNGPVYNVSLSDLPRSGYRTQPRVKALRNPGYSILIRDQL